jgi:hypothetical protein
MPAKVHFPILFFGQQSTNNNKIVCERFTLFSSKEREREKRFTGQVETSWKACFQFFYYFNKDFAISVAS